MEDLEDPLLQEEDESDLPLVVPLSNAHVELMLVQALGPQSVDEVVNLLKKIKMVKDPHNTSIVVAVDYVRRWKEEARWCRHFLPGPITMMKYFAEGIYPRKLAESLKNQRCKSMDECMTSFIVKYRTYSAAKRTVDCYDDGETPQKEDRKAKHAGKGGTKESQATPSPPNPKSASKGDDAPKTITCYHCGEPGHKKPDCPKLKSSAAAAAPPKRVGALTMGTRARAGPYLACDVSAPEDVRGAAVPRVHAKGREARRCAWDRGVLGAA